MVDINSVQILRTALNSLAAPAAQDAAATGAPGANVRSVGDKGIGGQPAYTSSATTPPRAAQLSNLLTNLSQAASALKEGIGDIKALNSLVEQAQDTAQEAQGLQDRELRASLSALFDALRENIDESVDIAGSSSLSGTSLVSGDNLLIEGDGRSRPSEIVGTRLDSDGLGLGAADNAWQDDADIDAALIDVGSALATLRVQGDVFQRALDALPERAAGAVTRIVGLQDVPEDAASSSPDLDAATLSARDGLSSLNLSLTDPGNTNALRLL